MHVLSASAELATSGSTQHMLTLTLTLTAGQSDDGLYSSSPSIAQSVLFDSQVSRHSKPVLQECTHAGDSTRLVEKLPMIEQSTGNRSTSITTGNLNDICSL